MEQGRRKKASPLTAAKTILSSFLGIRRRSGHEAESVRLTPVQIVVAGVIGAAVLVLLLVALVKIIVASAG